MEKLRRDPPPITLIKSRTSKLLVISGVPGTRIEVPITKIIKATNVKPILFRKSLFVGANNCFKV